MYDRAPVAQSPHPTASAPRYFRKFYLNRATRVTTAGGNGRPRGADRGHPAARRHSRARHPRCRMRPRPDAHRLRRIVAAGSLPRPRGQRISVRALNWSFGSVVDFRPVEPYDLVICYDVLQYLGERDAARAIANLAALSRAALYVSALTRRIGAAIATAAAPIATCICAPATLVPAPAAQALPPSRLRCMGPQERHGDRVGHGAARAVEKHTGAADDPLRFPSTQFTSAACTGSPAPVSARTSLIRQTTT